MNFADLIDTLRVKTGYSDLTATTFKDSLLQEYRDAINSTLCEISSTCSPFFFALTREKSIMLVPGQAYYQIDDWCQRILSIYTNDIAAHKLEYIRPRNADIRGFRNPSYVDASLGPYRYTDGMRSVTSLYSGQCFPAESHTVLDQTTGADAVGRMFRFSGQGEDYQVTSQVSTTIVFDKPLTPRLRGDGTTGVGTIPTGLTPFQIGPPGRVTIQILPTPTTSRTLICRYMALNRTLIVDTDTPEIQQEYHDLIWKGALKNIAVSKQNTEMYQMYQTEYAEALANFKKSDADDQESDDAPRFERPGCRWERGTPYGAYSRGDQYGPSGVNQWY